MNQKIGTCALCKRENIERRQSHIIPKGVYRRSRIKENSHFKNHFHPEEIFQDGEKKYMLCGDCEKFFNSYETPFFNRYLNKYLGQPSFSLSNPSAEIEFYFLTVAWRVLYDDLYECGSFENQAERIMFEEFEQILWKYLFTEFSKIHPEVMRKQGTDSIALEGKTFGELIAIAEKERLESMPPDISKIRNHVYILEELGFPSEISDLFSHGVCGYCFFEKSHKNYYVISLYQGLAIVTVYHRHLMPYSKRIADFLIDNRITRAKIKSSTRVQIIDYLQEIADYSPEERN